MGSPLSPVMAHIYMEAFEKKALESTTLKPKYRYVDDTFIIWPHGHNTVVDFLDHFNGIRPDIQFTKEVEKNAALPFLDVLRYLNAESHHHSAQKQGIINTLIHRARIISEPRYSAEELEHLRTALRGNGYTARNIERAIKKRHTPMEKQEYLVTTYLPKIGRLLKKRNINTVFSSVKKVAAAFPKTCNNIQLQGPGVNSIPCSCGKAYIGQTGRHINTRLKEHKSHLKNNNWEKSAIAEHMAYTINMHFILV
ncbi:uncharacterized protein LOC108915650 [Anoplophora glabripennis]|uniref:uncharacterized protein LOC108915650 n=1 Tax=Anoplophora glabripennis TaxID=217634 RepID=UPI000874E4CF|nr:uncharacterized protein LOC108915650 [Anoplophora glabripennis]